jgi:tRNA U34 2-thiouridine synthase MnmA/TrmU
MKAIALISGGLDSSLAAKLIKEQGIEVIGLKFKIPFSSSQRKPPADLGFQIQELDIAAEFLEIVKYPQHGLGANINPCIDCKILMLSKARELMKQWNAKFIITGEVLGQRPMSQHRQALDLIVKKANLEGLVLRPLSARLLAETIPEREGWVRRSELLALSGRSRNSQIELAKTLGIKEYSQPAGGCLLTDPAFAKRLKDLIAYSELDPNNVELLKLGRHFRLSQSAKLVVGRNEEENARLENLGQENDYLFMPTETAGPTALGRGAFDTALIELACQIVCRYCDLNGKINAKILYQRIPDKVDKILEVSPFTEAELKKLRV